MAATNDDRSPTLDELELQADADRQDYFLFLAAWASDRRCR